ncbi:hypothetical protein [Streptomyces vinaceus]|uniref:hypothetical protein n=1 Tax=Streptomyces vinaceus TaxID=1960 RepID=UPI00368C41AA
MSRRAVLRAERLLLDDVVIVRVDSMCTGEPRGADCPVTGKPLPLCLAALCVLAAAACGTDRGVTAAPPAGRDVAAPTHAHATAPSASASALALKLVHQFREGKVGGIPFSCAATRNPSAGGRPAVWVSSQTTDTRAVALGARSVLCLSGFPGTGPITVTVKAGGHTYTTALKRVGKSVSKQSDAALFDGREMEVTEKGSGMLTSGDWRFLPSSSVREALGRAGRLDLTAASGDVKATNAQPLSRQPGAATEDGWERSRRVALYGYPAGAHVPVGLYRVKASPEGPNAVLERQVGEVVMPASRVAGFTIPQDVFRSVSAVAPEGKDTYCLSVPVVDQCVTHPV